MVGEVICDRCGEYAAFRVEAGGMTCYQCDCGKWTVRHITSDIPDFAPADLSQTGPNA